MIMNITKQRFCGILAMVVLISCQDKEMGNKAYIKGELPVIEKGIRNAIGWAKIKILAFCTVLLPTIQITWR
jgi:hypothetical protein